MRGANIQIAHYFDHGYLEEETSMIHSFTVTLGANIGQAWSVVFLPTKLSALLKIIVFIILKKKQQHKILKFTFVRYVIFRSR